MKLRKSLLLSLIMIFILALTCFSGCNLLKSNDNNGEDDKVTVVSIVKTQTNGLIDTYTITYSDGSTFNFEITNGKDGADGEDLDIDEVFEKYLEIHPNATYEEFLKAIIGTSEDVITLTINKALQSMANIYVEFTETTGQWPTATTDTAVALGSAVVYKVDTDYTYFITNYHVLYSASALETNKLPKKIVCYLYGSEDGPVSTGTKDASGYSVYEYGPYAIDCEYVGGLLKSDIAVVKAPTSRVKQINPNVKAVTFADDYHVGDMAIAIGNPKGEGISVSQGIVSVDSEYIKLSIDGTSKSYRVMRIDAALYHGSSGGGLFNKDGKLIGITNAGDGDDQNINYAVPLSVVKNTVESIIYYNDNPKAITLGVKVAATNSRYVFDEQKGYGEIIETITVDEIANGSISAKLGLQLGDVLVSMFINGNEYKINRMFNIGDALLTIRNGDKISFKLIRNAQTMTSNEYTILSSDLN